MTNMKVVMLKRFFLSLFLLLATYLILPAHAFASQDFSTAYNVTYSVSDSGSTHSLMQISLTNNTSDYYASSYKIEVGFPHITNLHASDGGGSIVPTVTQSNEGNIVGLSFNQKVVGIHKTLKFSLSFDTQDVAQEHGKVWEINIPGI